jgi:hypothetical protein
MVRRGLDRRWLAVLALSGLAVIGGYGWHFQAEPERVVLAPDGCDIQQGACRRELPGGGELVFEILPRPIPVAQRLRLRVQLRDVPAERVEVDFSGVDMRMLYNRPRLTPLGEGRFEGETSLSVCIRQRMRWEARVLLRLPERIIEVPYRFDTTRS